MKTIRWTGCTATGALLLAALCLGAIGCASKPRLHPQQVSALVSDNPPPPQPEFAALPAEEEAALFDDTVVETYRIGVMDVLQVIGDTEFLKGFGETSKGDVIGAQVKSDGSIYLPVLGRVPAAGLTAVELQDNLRERLTKYKSDPFVSVDVLEYRSQRFFMLGAVGKPGVFPVNGTASLLEGLSLAGALTSEADLERAYFVRDSRILPISIGDMLLRGNTKRNIYMKHGDMVVVPHWDKRQIAYVFGEVGSPGPIAFVDGHLTLAAAIAGAGDIDRKYANQNVIRIFRGNWPCPTSYTLAACEVYAHGESIELRPGDRVLVAPSGMATASRALELFQPILNTLTQPVVTAAAVSNLGR